MWLGIDASSWGQLWSGVIGSFIAAVIGGLVALMVVRLTNGHQSKTAAKGRVVAAIADFSAAVIMFPRTLNDERDSIQGLVKQAEFASTRIVMEMDDHALAKELSLWPLELGYLALRASQLRQEGDEARALEAQGHLYVVSREVTATISLWARAPRREAASWTSKLENLRKSFSSLAKTFRK